jgi:hypothetical protein
VGSLRHRGYEVWLDIDSMKGSTIDAMSDAVDHAAVMLYGVSKRCLLPSPHCCAHSCAHCRAHSCANCTLLCARYKESANCRLEANYAHQRQVDMVPLMMQSSYHPTGWLGMLLGTRMYYSFFDSEDDDDAMFEWQIDAIVREVKEWAMAAAPHHHAEYCVPTPQQQSQPAVAPGMALPRVSNGVPTPAPAPAPAPIPAPAPATATTTLDRSSTPSMMLTPTSAALPPPGATWVARVWPWHATRT